MMDGRQVIERCRALAACTEEPGYITRTFLSPPMRQAHSLVRGWMEAAGMRVSVDAVGNLRGIYGDGPRLMIGSHLDTVPHAGAFDGILGVMMGIALVEQRPPCAVEVVGFSEEEGVRFGVPFIGSRALVGDPVMDPAVLQAIRDFGLNPDEIPAAAIADDVRGYLEFHIEQGPVLEREGLALGVVDWIVGQSRAQVEFRGKAGHAGATPMDARSDALAAAAEWIGAAEKAAREQGMVATVGRLEVEPGAINVIPGVARASLDIRDGNDDKLAKALDSLEALAREIARRRGVTVCWAVHSTQAAVEMDPVMTTLLYDAVEAVGYQTRRLSSGAGHDAMILARKVPAAMLFLRSPGGVSHHPDENVAAEDVEAALEAAQAFLPVCPLLATEAPHA